MYLGSYLSFGERFIIYVHVVHRTSDEVRRFRAFKERLAQDPVLLEEYCACKRRIIAEGVTDTDDYAVRKRPFFHKILGRDYALGKADA